MNFLEISHMHKFQIICTKIIFFLDYSTYNNRGWTRKECLCQKKQGKKVCLSLLSYRSGNISLKFVSNDSHMSNLNHHHTLATSKLKCTVLDFQHSWSIWKPKINMLWINSFSRNHTYFLQIKIQSE